MLTRDKKLLLLIAVISTSFIISYQVAQAQNQTTTSKILDECKQFNTKHIYAGIHPGYNMTDLDNASVQCFDMPKMDDHGWQVIGYIIDSHTISEMGKIYHKPDMEVVP